MQDCWFCLERQIWVATRQDKIRQDNKTAQHTTHHKATHNTTQGNTQATTRHDTTYKTTRHDTTRHETRRPDKTGGDEILEPLMFGWWSKIFTFLSFPITHSFFHHIRLYPHLQYKSIRGLSRIKIVFDSSSLHAPTSLFFLPTPHPNPFLRGLCCGCGYAKVWTCSDTFPPSFLSPKEVCKHDCKSSKKKRQRMVVVSLRNPSFRPFPLLPFRTCCCLPNILCLWLVSKCRIQFSFFLSNWFIHYFESTRHILNVSFDKTFAAPTILTVGGNVYDAVILASVGICHDVDKTKIKTRQ